MLEHNSLPTNNLHRITISRAGSNSDESFSAADLTPTTKQNVHSPCCMIRECLRRLLRKHLGRTRRVLTLNICGFCLSAMNCVCCGFQVIVVQEIYNSPRNQVKMVLSQTELGYDHVLSAGKGRKEWPGKVLSRALA